jgi:hypothetical protein
VLIANRFQSVMWTLVLGHLAAKAGVAGAVEIPVNVGIGPAAFYIPEHLEDGDPKPFFGLRLHIKAVIDRETIKQYKNEIPAQYRKAVEGVSEVRVGYLLIPESILLGHRKTEGGPELYGATWRPIAMGMPIQIGPVRLSLGTGFLITYAYVNTGKYKIIDHKDQHSTVMVGSSDAQYRSKVTNFLRPGADVGLDLELRLSDAILVSLGWSSAYYLPQKIGGSITTTGMGDLQNSIWRVHQAYLVANYRMPVEVRL